MENNPGNIEPISTIETLESLATEVLKLKKERKQRRPIIIEFCGCPKSGKTTTITSLNIFLKRNNFNTIVLSERASVCPVKDKKHPYFNIWTMCSTIAEIIKFYSSKENIDIIIADRGIFDALCWFEWLNSNDTVKNPRLDDNKYNALINFALMDTWTNIIDLVYVFQVPPETSIMREYATLLTKKEGSIMNKKTLSSIHTSINTAVNKYASKFKRVERIDTSKDQNNQNKVGYIVTTTTLRVLKDLLVEKIGYFEEDIQPLLKKGINNYDNIIKNQVLKFENRDIVENNDFIQPLPIAVITDKNREHILVVKKNKKRTSNTSPERGRLLVYLGGHLREEDYIDSNLKKAINNGLHRELEEELNEPISVDKCEKFLIYTPYNTKSKRHLAICHIVTLDLEDRIFKLDENEFIQKKGKTQHGKIIKVKDLYKQYDSMEDWSKLILEQVFNMKASPQLNLQY